MTVEHLEWLVKSRTANQTAAIKLYGLFKNFPDRIKQEHLSAPAYNLVAVCFSLWRAAFLADQIDEPDAVFKNALDFLEKILVDNAIAYSADRSSREWTFSYYMIASFDRLNALPEAWTEVKQGLNTDHSKPATTTWQQHRWNVHQRVFEIAVECFEKELKAIPPEIGL